MPFCNTSKTSPNGSFIDTSSKNNSRKTIGGKLPSQKIKVQVKKSYKKGRGLNSDLT